jgi:hypothetical protein
MINVVYLFDEPRHEICLRHGGEIGKCDDGSSGQGRHKRGHVPERSEARLSEMDLVHSPQPLTLSDIIKYS